MIATDNFVAHIFVKYKSAWCDLSAFHLTNKFQAGHRPNSIVSSFLSLVRFVRFYFQFYQKLNFFLIFFSSFCDFLRKKKLFISCGLWGV